jgi:hypothetical protein
MLVLNKCVGCFGTPIRTNVVLAITANTTTLREIPSKYPNGIQENRVMNVSTGETKLSASMTLVVASSMEKVMIALTPLESAKGQDARSAKVEKLNKLLLQLSPLLKQNRIPQQQHPLIEAAKEIAAATENRKLGR